MKPFGMAIVALLAASGCAQTAPVWVKQGSTQQSFDIDMGQCQAQAFSVPGMPPAQVSMVFSACMRGKGWRQETRTAAQ